MFKIRSISEENISVVRKILSDWLGKEEVDHYTESIQAVISDSPSEPKLDSHYYIAELGKNVVGVTGFRIPNPKIVKFATARKPAELCMLYVAKEHRGGRGVGTALLDHVIDQAKSKEYEELLVRSSEKFADTGWGFYDHKGFKRVGELLSEETGKKSQIWSKRI